MELTIDVPEKDLLAFGKETIQHEFGKTLKWLKIKQSFQQISGSLKDLDEKAYFQQVEKIRASAWEQYKQDPVQ